MYFDYYYLILVVPMLLLSLYAQFKVKSTYSKYSKVANSRHLTGESAARMLLSAGGVSGVRVERISGELTDHYDPKADTIRLSDGVYNSTSIAAIGIACHEAGHAMQYHTSYVPIKFRMTLVPICNFASKLSLPLMLLGVILNFGSLALIGVIAFGIANLFELVTLPVEFNASRRAIKAIEDNNFLYGDEVKAAKKVLSAAALTYVAALAVAIANFLRYLIIFGSNRRRD